MTLLVLVSYDNWHQTLVLDHGTEGWGVGWPEPDFFSFSEQANRPWEARDDMERLT
jgi:hypothetical protein